MAWRLLLAEPNQLLRCAVVIPVCLANGLPIQRVFLAHARSSEGRKRLQRQVGRADTRRVRCGKGLLSRVAGLTGAQ